MIKIFFLTLCLLIPVAVCSNECPSNKAIFTSDDGKNEFKVKRVAYKHKLMCSSKINKRVYEDPQIYMEIDTPTIDFSYYYDRIIIKNHETGKEQAPIKCDSIQWLTIAEGFYNKEIAYIIETVNRGQVGCCTVERLNKIEFQKAFGNPKYIRWLTDQEAVELTLGLPYDKSVPTIQVFDGMGNSGPELKLKQCQT